AGRQHKAKAGTGAALRTVRSRICTDDRLYRSKREKNRQNRSERDFGGGQIGRRLQRNTFCVSFAAPGGGLPVRRSTHAVRRAVKASSSLQYRKSAFAFARRSNLKGCK